MARSECAPLALDGSDHGHLALGAAPMAPVMRTMPIEPLAADVGLINLDNPHELTEFLIGEPGAEPMAHIPSRLVGAKPENPENPERAGYQRRSPA